MPTPDARTSPRIVHFSDTHLGYSEHAAADPATGVNVRETDFYRAFRRVVDDIVAKRPALAIHAGDLFDMVRPPNRAISEAIEGFRRIVAAGVPLVVIAGNHETPRVRATGNIFRALQAALPEVHFVFDGAYRTIEIGDLAVHAIADAATDEALDANLRAVRALPDRDNVLVLHAGTSRLQSSVSSGEFNQHFVPHERLQALSDFAYLAFGHYHRPMAIEGVENAWYSGSTERTGFSDARHACGYLEVDLSPLRVRHVEVPVRPMIDFGAIDCAGLDDRRALDALRATVEGKVTDAVFRVVLADLSAPAMAAISLEDLAAIKRPALHGEIVQQPSAGARGGPGEALSFASLPVEFERFLAARADLAGPEGERLRRLGLDYLARCGRGDAE